MIMKKIGVLDSGIGGLSILKELINHKFNASYYYASDNKNVPYGNKGQEFMLKRMRILVNLLLQENVEVIIIACNTATAETIGKLRQEFQVEFIGIEPYINYLNHTNNKSIGLILTESTFKSQRFKELCEKYDPGKIIQIHPLKNLALLIESLKEKPFEEIRNAINNELEFLIEKKYEFLILGCTHYPIIAQYIEVFLNTKTIDPTENVINRISDLLKLEKNSNGNDQFFYNESISKDWQSLKTTHFKFLNQ
jgi:glutamate racemase